MCPPRLEMGIEVGCMAGRVPAVPSTCAVLHRRVPQHWTTLHYQSIPTPTARRLWHSPHSMALTNARVGHHSNMEGVWSGCCLLRCRGRQSGCWCCS